MPLKKKIANFVFSTVCLAQKYTVAPTAHRVIDTVTFSIPHFFIVISFVFSLLTYLPLSPNVFSGFWYLLATWSPVQQATLNWGGDSCQEFRVRANSSVFLHINIIFQSDTMFQLTLMLIVSLTLFNSLKNAVTPITLSTWSILIVLVSNSIFGFYPDYSAVCGI